MNLALLRVFGILIAVHELNRLVRLLLQVTMSGFDEGESFTDIAPMILASVAIILVVCIATFFINVEESKFYLQKLKALFFKCKNLT